MKETFKLFITNELEKYNSILANNSLTDEDKTSIENTINYLNDVMSKLEEVNDNEGIEELKNSITELQDSLTAIKEKIAQNQNKIEEENKNEITMENYLSTKNCVTDFVSVIKNSRNGNEFQKNWRNMLAQNSIEITEGSEYAFLPELVKGQIQDIWSKRSDWLSLLKTVNAKGYIVRVNTGDQDDADSRARGWHAGCTKTEQDIVLAAKKCIPQFIYKINSVDAEMKFNDDGSLLNYLMEELVGQIIYEIKRAILIGDGREEGCGHIDSIEAIYKGEEAVSDAYTTIVERTENSFMLDDLHNLVSKLKKDGDEEVVVFIASSAIGEATRVAASETSTPLYLEDEQLARQIRASRIVVTDILDLAEITAIALIPNRYVLVGEGILNPTLFTQHDIYKNTDVFRFECIVGGTIEGLKCSAVLKPYVASDDQNNG